MKHKAIQIGPTHFKWGTKTYIMGIVNVTPDSFSGDGLIHGTYWIDAAVEQARSFAEAGVDILDVGGESTRPGAAPVEADQEIARVLPVLERLTNEFDLPISIDTYKGSVALAALEAGAHFVNDVWGLQMDPDMGKVCAERDVPIVLMHNRSKPRNAIQEERLGGRYIGTEYDNLVEDVISELQESIDLAKAAGVPDKNIMIDPGIGFGKTIEQNLELLNNLDRLQILGYPMLLGTSNKSFIGYTLDLPPNDRVEGTAATIAIGIAKGADIVRVHNVKAMSRVAKMTDAIVRPLS